MSNDMNTKIKIPTDWYAGFTKTRDGLPNVFMTPNGTDKASQGRINTIQRYSNGDRGIPDTVLPNTPLCGFKVIKPVSGGYSTNKIVWQIEDPRGFKSEIPSGNMGQLLALTTVDHCEILESCVWARDGKDNVLLPTNSVEYQTAVKNTELSKLSVHIGKVKLGNVVHLKNGKRNMKYLGKYYEYTGHEHRYNKTPESSVYSSASFYYEDPEGVIYDYGSGNVAEIVDANSTMTPAEAEQHLNDLKPNQIYMSVVPVFGTNVTVELKPLDISTKFLTPNYHHENVLMMRFSDGELGYCGYPRLNRFHATADKLGFVLIQKDMWDRGLIFGQIERVESRWHRGHYGNQEVTRQVDPTQLGPDEEAYEIELTWTTDHGSFKKKLRT